MGAIDSSQGAKVCDRGRLRAIRGSCYGLKTHGFPSHPLSPVRRIDAVSMHLYGAGIRMVRGSFKLRSVSSRPLLF